MTTQSMTVIQVTDHDRESTARFSADIFGWDIHHEPTYTWFEASAAPSNPSVAGQLPLAPFIVLVDSGAACAYTRTA